MKKRILVLLLLLVVASLASALVACDIFGSRLATPTVEIETDSTATSITFDVKVKDKDNVGAISKIELIHGEDTVSLDDLTVRRFDNLLSNNKYSIRVTYTYDLQDGNGARELVETVSVTTLAKAVPTVKITNLWVTESAIKADLKITDEDKVGSLEEIKLVGKDSSAKYAQTIDFDNLVYGERYGIFVTYKYDLGDGKGEKSVIEGTFVTVDNQTIHQTSCKLDYAVVEGGCQVKGNRACEHEEIYVPETIDGYTVTGIGNDAFRDFRKLTRVVIPERVTSIGNGAFLECSKMHTVTFEGNSKLVSFGSQAFYGCARLTTITIPKNVAFIGTGAFIACAGLQTVTFEGNKLTSIGDNTFYSCDSLTDFVIPEGVTDIGVNAFYGCDILTTVTIPTSVTYIGNAFAHCDKLKTIYYSGTEAQWNEIEIVGNDVAFSRVTFYFYSETPETGKWHYDADGKPTLWN